MLKSPLSLIFDFNKSNDFHTMIVNISEQLHVFLFFVINYDKMSHGRQKAKNIKPRT